MRDPLLPLEAVARTAGILVDRPRSQVVHVATPARALTSTGRLAKGERPICNQPGRPCRRARFDGRPLCRRCVTVVIVTTSGLHRAELTETRLRATITSTRTADELASAVRLLCYAAPGVTRRLSEAVRDQRRILGLDSARPIVLPPQRPRFERKRAAWQREVQP